MLLFSSMGWFKRLFDRFKKYNRGNAVKMFATYEKKCVQILRRGHNPYFQQTKSCFLIDGLVQEVDGQVQKVQPLKRHQAIHHL
jgi:hypothetical protein